MPRPKFFPTVKTRPEFLAIKKSGLSWASKSFIIQGLITLPPLSVNTSNQQSDLDKKLSSFYTQSSDPIDFKQDDHHQKKSSKSQVVSASNIYSYQNDSKNAGNSQHDNIAKCLNDHNISNNVQTALASLNTPLDQNSTQETHNDRSQNLKLASNDYQNQCIGSALTLIDSDNNQDILNIKHQKINNNDNDIHQDQQTGDDLVFMIDAESLIATDIKIGYVVTKKIGNAVKRNRAKRRLRELCKTGSDLFQKVPAQYVIIARHSILTQPFDILLNELAWTLKHVYRLHDQQNKTS